MVSCQVRTGVLPIVKVKPPNERVYQLIYADQRDSDPKPTGERADTQTPITFELDSTVYRAG